MRRNPIRLEPTSLRAPECKIIPSLLFMQTLYSFYVTTWPPETKCLLKMSPCAISKYLMLPFNIDFFEFGSTVARSNHTYYKACCL